jgi:hypothetical protein
VRPTFIRVDGWFLSLAATELLEVAEPSVLSTLPEMTADTEAANIASDNTITCTLNIKGSDTRYWGGGIKRRRVE